jgi:hypothetical protein
LVLQKFFVHRGLLPRNNVRLRSPHFSQAFEASLLHSVERSGNFIDESWCLRRRDVTAMVGFDLHKVVMEREPRHLASVCNFGSHRAIAKGMLGLI